MKSTLQQSKILLLGPDKYVVRACISHEVDAVVICGSAAWDKGMMQIPDTLRMIRVEDQVSPEGIIAALHRERIDPGSFDAIHTSDEWGIANAGLLARYFGCRGIDPGTAVRFRDKYLQKQAVAAAGLKTARTEVINDIFDVSAYSDLPWNRAVLKPIAGAATMHTSVLANIDELRAQSASFRAKGSAQRMFLLEEFIPGEEWLADGAVLDGHLIFFSLGRYGEPCLSAINEEHPIWRRRMDPIFEQWTYELAEPLITQALRSLGLSDGVFHMEMFYDSASRGLTFGECAARRGGGLITEEIMAKTGVDMGELALQCALGEAPELNLRKRSETIGSTVFTAPPGIMVECPSNAEILELPHVEYAWVEKAHGTSFSGHASSTVDNIVGHVLMAADSEEQLIDYLSSARSWFTQRSVVLPNSRTQRDLRSWQEELHPGSASGTDLWFGSWKTPHHGLE